MPSTTGLHGRLGLAFDVHTPPAVDGPTVERLRARLGRLHRQYLADAVAHRQLYALDDRLPHTLRALIPGRGADDLPGLCARTERALLAFDDSWTAAGWSAWWSGARASNRAIDVVVLHADDHKDVTSPFLTPDGDAWIDLLTGRAMSLREPRSVADAVVSGAIGIGSFIAPWLHTWHRMELRHLRAGGPPIERAALLPSYARVDESVGIRRPTITMRSAGNALDERDEHREQGEPDAVASLRSGTSSSRHVDSTTVSPVVSSGASASVSSIAVADESVYIGTDDLAAWTADIPADAAVLLHIDLDYFNDRHGGGHPSPGRDPSEFESLIRVREICTALAARGLAARIEHTAICCSPGFCPSERWEALLWHLRDGLKRIGCPCV